MLEGLQAVSGDNGGIRRMKDYAIILEKFDPQRERSWQPKQHHKPATP